MRFRLLSIAAAACFALTAGAAHADEEAEAPPPPPHKPGVALDAHVGVFGFIGGFGKVAPPGPWLHLQAGYEIFRWLYVFGESELSFTDTSNAQPQPNTRAFPIYGFGGGARGTVKITDRVGVYLQGSVGGMKADITNGALRILGYGDAENLNLYFGGRLGVEWYQLDRHLALGLTGGLRDATGFKKTTGGSLPLAWDGGVALRYSF